jgi:SNF2 family DNA or RNA helicase
VTQLDPFQLETLAFLDAAGGRAVLADPMGARKTGTILSWLASAPCGNVLVVAPSAVHRHWQREAERFYPEASAVIGQGSKRHKVLANVFDQPNPLYITTYDSHKADQDNLLGNFDTIVYDEAHRLKGRTTQVATAGNYFARSCRSVICATGTPVLNHASELWQYLHMLAPKQYKSFWRWVEHYFEIEFAYFQGRMGPQTKVIKGIKEGLEAELRAEIAPYFLQRELIELYPGAAWIEEPEHVKIEVVLSTAERKVYDNLVKHSWAISETGQEITTSNAAVLNTRLQQVTAEWGTLDDQLNVGTKTKATIELVADLVERDEPVVVFAQYKQQVNRIVEGLLKRHIGTVSYTGDMTADQRDGSVQAFRHGTNTKVLVGTLASLSEGVDGLQDRCSNVVMVNRWWVPGKNDQAIGRLRRSGQAKPVTVWHIFAEETTDVAEVQACLDKVNVIQVLKGKPLIDAIYGR